MSKNVCLGCKKDRIIKMLGCNRNCNNATDNIARAQEYKDKNNWDATDNIALTQKDRIIKKFFFWTYRTVCAANEHTSVKNEKQ